MANVENVALPKGTRLIFGNQEYVIDHVLGAGGFGITYFATSSHGAMTLQFAVKEHFIKRLCDRDSLSGSVSYNERDAEDVENSLLDFIAEATRLKDNDLKHPNLVKIFDVFEANGTAYYIMEFIDGVSLRQLVQKDRNKPDDVNPLPENTVLTIMTPVLDAIALLHGARITHLDLKPDNIQMGKTLEPGRYRPVIIDFGLSKHYDKKGNATSTIRSIGCSDGYSPLEQYSGITRFSPTADIYSLGATLYFALTGRRPEKASELQWTLAEKQLKAHNVSPRVCKALEHAMAKTPEARTQSVEDFASELGIRLGTPDDGDTTVLISPDHKKNHGDGEGGKSSAIKKYLVPALIGIIFAVLGFFLFKALSGHPEQTPAADTAQHVSIDAGEEETAPIEVPGMDDALSGHTKPQNDGKAEVKQEEAATSITSAAAPAKEKQKPQAAAEPSGNAQKQAYDNAMKHLHNGDIDGARRAAAGASPEDRAKIEQAIKRSGFED